jgi:hypothetical protein
LFTPSTKRSTVKSVSPLSGALAASHQRQQSAGQASSAASVKMPRRLLVENLPPSKVSQLKPLIVEFRGQDGCCTSVCTTESVGEGPYVEPALLRGSQ